LAKRVFRMPDSSGRQLEISSGGRPGPRPRGALVSSDFALIARTIRHSPEVMVKVTGGGTKLAAVRAHFGYISRGGKLTVETDDGEALKGKEAVKALVDEWHLDLTAGQYRRPRAGRTPPRPIKLVNHVVLSMPAPTLPDKVLAAAKTFAREKFGTEHRYAMVLHTDQRHPHVHLVVKAEGARGHRLRIDKAALRQWRADFARYLRDLGVEANATPRFARGRNAGKQRDELVHAQRRRASTTVRDRVTAVAQELVRGALEDPGREKLLRTRRAVVAGWLAVAQQLDRQGESALAANVRLFVREMPPVMTDKERIARDLMETHSSERNRNGAAQNRKKRDLRERTR
jgi:hypothetical protein